MAMAEMGRTLRDPRHTRLREWGRIQPTPDPIMPNLPFLAGIGLYAL